MTFYCYIFEKFRNNGLKNYKLYQNYYLSTLASSWDAMFNMTKVKLELITDPDMYIFFKKGMRGGVSYISNDIVKPATSIWKSCDSKQNSKHIIYLDTHNLCGYTKFLPTSGFKWIDPKDIY